MSGKETSPETAVFELGHMVKTRAPVGWHASLGRGKQQFHQYPSRFMVGRVYKKHLLPVLRAEFDRRTLSGKDVLAYVQ